MRMRDLVKNKLLLLILISISIAVCAADKIADNNDDIQTLMKNVLEDNGNTEVSSMSSHNRCEHREQWELDGGFLIYFLLMAYIFIGFELICDAFFVPALNVFCEKLHLSDDFAGATLMALGGNAPDIFSGIVGLLVLETDVGPGTIVGSLLFNHLCIIGCTVLSLGAVKLDMRSVSREMIFYFISIVLFAVTLWDKDVTTIESGIYLVVYLIYVVFCWFTPRIYDFFGNLFKCCCRKKKVTSYTNIQDPLLGENGITSVYIAPEEEVNSDDEEAAEEHKQKEAAGEVSPVPKFVQDISQNPAQGSMEIMPLSDNPDGGSAIFVPPKLEKEKPTGEALRALRKRNSDILRRTFHETYSACVEEATKDGELDSGHNVGLNYGDVLMQGYLTKKSRWYSKLGVTSRTWQKRWFVLGETFWYCRDPSNLNKIVHIPLWKAWKVEGNRADAFEFSIFTPSQTYVLRANSIQNAAKWIRVLSSRLHMMKERNPDLYEENGICEVEPDDEEESLFTFPSDGSIFQAALWVLSLPYAALFTITIPDVRRDRCRNLFVITFLMVLVWLGIMAYAMVWGADNFARVLCIPEDVMGLTITAMGASLPSLFSSVIAAKQGMANMAISNAFGANLCSILLALGLPMFVFSLARGQPYHTDSSAISVAAIVLVVALVIFIISAAVSKFTLNKVHAIICLILYAVLLTFVVLMGLNVFTFTTSSSD